VPELNPTRIYVDADACPVKDEIYRVAIRHGLPVSVVAGNFIRVPQDPLIERIAAGSGMDAADDWIAERAGKGDIVITSDIPLASRCVKSGAEVIAPNGKPFTEQSIGMTLAVRNLMTDLRSSGEVTGGPKSYSRAILGILSAPRPDHPTHQPAGATAQIRLNDGAAAIQLKDVRLTLAARRCCRRAVGVVGRARLPDRPQWPGKSTLPKIAAGPSNRTAAAASCSPAPPSAICRRSLTSATTRRRWPVALALAPATTYQARYLVEALGPHGDEDPAHVSGGEACRAARAGAGALARYPAAGRADQPSRSSNHRMAGKRAGKPPLRARHHQP
jgi:uncharacterized protein YaiI (UPF0178 family)